MNSASVIFFFFFRRIRYILVYYQRLHLQRDLSSLLTLQLVRFITAVFVLGAENWIGSLWMQRKGKYPLCFSDPRGYLVRSTTCLYTLGPVAVGCNLTILLYSGQHQVWFDIDLDQFGHLMVQKDAGHFMVQSYQVSPSRFYLLSHCWG